MKRKPFLKTVFFACTGVFAVALAGFFVFGLWMYVSFHRADSRELASSGPNAIWARHKWVGARHTEVEYRALFDGFRRNHITDVYFHVGPWLDSDGGISPRKYSHALELLAAMRRLCPGMRAHAWIGQMTVPGGGPLNLANEDVRKNIVAAARQFLDMGFDGVHYDFEPVYTGDQNYIDLLKRTRAVAKKRQLISVASGQLEIAPGEIALMRRFAPRASIWTADYFLEVARYADQIDVMCYDTGLSADWMYGMYAREQTVRLARLLRGKSTLFMGVPTYSGDSAGHHADAENIETALKGINMGLKSAGESGRGVGVAIFAEWTTQQNEWKTWRAMRE